ncbi:hypothetical protein [uncultured Rikenella sp.]|uniref:hypothetical protein n=1 Tax=uncultured Rikenella sp. TaxID=368003 RepID=UPI0025FF33F4|nr:hypothetical protein [uncultured Rikenella sp.]
MRPAQSPAPGSRYRTSGVLYTVSNYGFSWSSTANDSSGVYLDFSATELHPSSTYYRGYGFQLRCLSE